MKILFINTGPWGTGSFTVIQGLSKELIKLNHSVKIFFPDANFKSIDMNQYYENPERYNIWVFPIAKQSIIIPTFPLMITDPHPRNPHPVTFKELSDDQLILYKQVLHRKLTELIETFQPDIIECHHIWYPGSILNSMGLNYLVTAHHSDQLGYRYDTRVQPCATACAQNSKKIFAISEFVKREVLRLYHVDESKIIVTPNGYDIDVFHPKKSERQTVLNNLGIEISHDASIVSFSGKLSRTKGIDILLAANKYLDPSLNIHFIVMGAGSIENICERMDPKLYSLRNIHFIGQQSPEMVSNIHNISRLSVMPSRSEGFGISCLEAMACGLPIVVSRSGGPEDFAVGKIIQKGSASELADAIQRLLHLPANEYQKLSEQAIRTAKQFSWRKIVDNHLDVYQEILPRNKLI